jgi:hypothetical protein
MLFLSLIYLFYQDDFVPQINIEVFTYNTYIILYNLKNKIGFITLSSIPFSFILC